MKAALSLTILTGSCSGALGVTTQCDAGYVHKDDLSGLMCMSNVNNAASCNSECCKNDENTCGGVDQKKPFQCPFNQFKAGDEAWKNTPATSDTAVKVCCAAKATCSSATCPAGYKLNTAAEQKLCSADAKSCALSLGADVASGACCIKDDLVCGGQAAAINCGSATKGLFVTGGAIEDDNWKKTPLNGVAAPAACCKALPLCSTASFSCPAGQKKKSTATPCLDKKGQKSASATDCGRDDGGELAKNPCCEADVAECFNLVKTSDAACSALGKYVAKTSYGLKYNKKTQCCTAQAKCKEATCPAGYTKNTASAAVACGGDAKECVKSAMLNTCCKLNVKTCGGLSGINCPYGFFNEKTMWNKGTAQSVQDAWNAKPANATNKNTNCCTPRAACDRTATTTPAAVTMTPAALKYSQHKAFVTQKPDASGSSALWLASGAFVGMTVMALVQKVRSTSARRDIVYSDDAEMLMTAGEQ